MKIKAQSPKQVKLTLVLDDSYDAYVLQQLLDSVRSNGNLDVEDLVDKIKQALKEAIK